MGDNTERKMMRKKAFDNKYLGFKSSTATLAVSFLDSGRNELFRPVLREPLFRDLTG